MKCRFCHNSIEYPFLSLGPSPVANSFLKKDDLSKMEPFYPLDIYVCKKCFLVQLKEFEPAKKIFSSDYAYFSSYSQSWLKHSKRYVEMIIKKLNLDKNSLVVEIGSNDGYLLQFFKKYGIPVLGIEPAKNTARTAIKKGIPTRMVFFNTSYAKEMVKKNRKADLIIGNNVLAHNPDLNDFVAGLKIALKPKGVVTMEFPHLLRLIKENQFDTIYHEHFSYFSLYTAKHLFSSHGLTLFDVEEIPTHGGSLRIYGKHKEDTKLVSKKVKDLLRKEKAAGLQNLKTYDDFTDRVNLAKRKLLEFLIKVKNKGKKIVGYGAPAKGNTLLNFCGIRTEFLDYTVDINPYKQRKYLPGTHILVKKPEEIKKDKPDYLLILPWNIKDEIMEQMSYICQWGGKFIIPIPKVQVI